LRRPVQTFPRLRAGNSQLPSRARHGKIFPAMGFANPFKGEPPDDFRADDSCR
jgi:hypothetical protein